MFKQTKIVWSWLIYLILILVILAVYYQVYTHDFISYDDNIYVYDNPNIQEGFTPRAIQWVFTTGRAGNWHPVTWLSHILDWQLFGANPAGHHITNLIFHVANVMLLLYVLKLMTKALWPSVFVAALFALHPLHVESVAWVSERKDVLSTFFWLLTMWAYVRFVRRPKMRNYLLIVLLFVVGLMSKPMLVTLPFVLLLLDYWPLERISSQKTNTGFRPHTLYKLVLEKVPLFIITILSSIVAIIAQQGTGAIAPTNALVLKFRIFNAITSYVLYIMKLVWPRGLSIFYPYYTSDVKTVSVILSLFTLLSISVLVLYFRKRHKYLVTGWLWYIGTLVPVIGLVQVGSQSMADRYTYIPLTGLFIIIAWGFDDLLGNWQYKRTTLAFCELLIIAGLSMCTYWQIGYWRNNETIFRHAVEVTEKNHVCHIHLADTLFKERRFKEASEEYKKYVQIIPDKPEIFKNLGVALLQQEKPDEAIIYLNKAVEINPDFADAHMKLGYALLLKGDCEKADKYLSEALRLDPNLSAAHYHLGQVLVMKGKYNESFPHFEQALHLKPDWVEPMNMMALFLLTKSESTIQDKKEALRLSQRACEITEYMYPDLMDTLAVAYAATGDFNRAIVTAERAIELCRWPAQDRLKEEIKKRLALYKAGKPYVEDL